MSNVSLKKIGNPGFVKDVGEAERLIKNLGILSGVKGAKVIVAYLADGKNNKNYRTGSEELSVFVQCAPSEEVLELEELEVELGAKYSLKRVVPKELGTGMVKICDENNVVVAFASIEYKTVYIPWMIEHLSPTEYTNIISYIVEYVFVNYFEELENIDSWKKSKQKAELKERVEKYLRKGNEKQIKDKEKGLKYAEEDLKTRQDEIKYLYDKVMKCRKELENAKNDKVIGLDNYLQGLDLIADHPKVENLIVKENNVEIKMNPLKIRAQINGVEKFYALNGAVIKLDVDSGKVRFGSETKRRSHWTAKDPHPHVNGSDGSACLGNVANTIAELCSEREIYPLFLVCLDFLENANTEDPAGKKVVNWDEIVEEVKVEKKKPGRPKKVVEEAQRFEVFTEFVEGGGYHTGVMMTEEEMVEAGAQPFGDDLVTGEVFEKLMKVMGE